MRIIVTAVVIIAVLGWAGFELRSVSKDWSNVMYILCAMVALVLFGVFFGFI